MDTLNQAISWYQQKVGAYDKQRWETSVEEKVLKSIENAPKKSAKVKSELIDVDLVRGSTFSKAKPQHGWLALAQKGILRVLFLPLYIRWWQKQTSTGFTVFVLFLYILQLSTCILYFMNQEDSISVENLSLAHVSSPMLVMVFLGVLHAQIFATNLNPRKSARRRPQANKSKITRKRQKPARTRYRHPSGKASQRTNINYDTWTDSAVSDFGCGKTDHIHQPQKIGHLTKLSVERVRNRATSAGGTNLTQRFAMTNGNRESENDKATSTRTDTNNEPSTDTLPSSREDSEEGPPATLSYTCLEGDSEVTTMSHEEGLRQHQIPPSTGEILSPAEFSQRISGHKCLQNGVEIHRADVRKDLQHSMDELPEGATSQEKQPPSQSSSAETIKADVVMDESQSSSQSSTKEQLGKPYGTQGKSYSPWPQKLTASMSQCGRKSANLLTVHIAECKESTGISSCESDTETAPNSPLTRKVQSSEVDWEDTMQTDGSSSCSTSATGSCTSNSSMSEKETQDDPFCGVPCASLPSMVNHLASGSDNVSCMIFEGPEVNKVDLSVLDIGWSIIQKVDERPETSDYAVVGVVVSVIMAIMPLVYRAYHIKDNVDIFSIAGLLDALPVLCGHDIKVLVIILNGVIQRLCVGLIFFFLLSVAERTFKQRLQYAKHFCYLTSSRRAKKYQLPHFRLNKVRNIKTWLSLRSYLKKRGPQRSVDTIVSASFLLAVTLVSLLSIELLRDSGTFLDYLGNWELVCWSMALGLYLLRFMTLGTKINKKYRNFSVLITEQINLYLHMEKKPHKKEELMLANNVLKLAEALLKELESPFKISGLAANPFLYNITKVVILSAFSGVLTELLGFKLKLYKIKLKS